MQSIRALSYPTYPKYITHHVYPKCLAQYPLHPTYTIQLKSSKQTDYNKNN